MIDESARAQQETEETAILVHGFESVEETRNHVVSARSLTTRKDYTHVDGRILFLGSGFETKHGHAVGVGEQLGDSLLVGHRLSGFAFDDGYAVFDGFGQLGLIRSTSSLKCTFLHCNHFYLCMFALSFFSWANFAFFFQRAKKLGNKFQ